MILLNCIQSLSSLNNRKRTSPVLLGSIKSNVYAKMLILLLHTTAVIRKSLISSVVAGNRDY